MLGRETSSHISVASFVDHDAPLPKFPAEVTPGIAPGQINLFEAIQLAGITPESLGGNPRSGLVRSNIFPETLS